MNAVRRMVVIGAVALGVALTGVATLAEHAADGRARADGVPPVVITGDTPWE
ncbi:hypothetical protein O7606_06155 [Micromonospora sp. WMMD882]|uniref:hypothetical protein n=1 Tax=Micromonospora sp. WMMD882 TaxID=3015151 RepID=UPI00248ACC4B|nr:hypothetical protein [Micromonospora sp. WMMD882]WBB80964.1 hypothetical protein O7606_06155 [Micromonospora sp. WMMD882]